MRKIELAMLSALAERRDWASYTNADGIVNTRVEFSKGGWDNPYLDATIYLYENAIAVLNTDGTIQAIPDTFYKWPTRTTGSRLSALGIFNTSGNNPVVYTRPVHADLANRHNYAPTEPTIQQQATSTLKRRI